MLQPGMKVKLPLDGGGTETAELLNWVGNNFPEPLLPLFEIPEMITGTGNGIFHFNFPNKRTISFRLENWLLVNVSRRAGEDRLLFAVYLGRLANNVRARTAYYFTNDINVAVGRALAEDEPGTYFFPDREGRKDNDG